MNNVLAIVMAGGAGERLQPLTRERAKAVVPFGGKIKLIDFTLSNCINSGLRQIYVLTQYQSESIHAHIRDGWDISSPVSNAFVCCVPAQEKTKLGWYRGTADAVRQNLDLLGRDDISEVLILSSDHVYKMDYLQLLSFHRRKKADVTISAIRVKKQQAAGTLGVLEADSDDKLIGFEEKPEQPRTITGAPDHSLASMGVYLFNTSFLMQTLKNSGDDFGKNIIPALAGKKSNVFIYDYEKENKIFDFKINIAGAAREKKLPDRTPDSRYWKDVGTIDSYYEASMELLSMFPPFDINSSGWRIRTSQRSMPASRCILGGKVINSIIGEGCIIRGGTVINSILSPGVIVEHGALVDHSIIFEDSIIEPGAWVRRTIVDKECNIRAGLSLGYDRELDAERGLTSSNSGIIVIPELSDVSDLMPAIY